MAFGAMTATGEPSCTGLTSLLRYEDSRVSICIKSRRRSRYVIPCFLVHTILIDLQVASLAWLRLPGQQDSAKLAKSDFEKRKEIFMELVYWLFDSFLIPLVRSNFHVTESNVHRHRLFYFRHDVWRMLTEPSLAIMKASIFEHMPTDRMTRLLSMRPLGFSKIRLLPKSHGFRTIMNLKRRQQVIKNGTTSLGRSINTVMTPVFNVLTYEKASNRNSPHLGIATNDQ
jgi:telomerase reverse transcriptase